MDTNLSEELNVKVRSVLRDKEDSDKTSSFVEFVEDTLWIITEIFINMI